MVKLGTKYQTYVDDKLVVLRLIKIKEGGKKFVLLDEYGDKIYLTDEQLSKYVILRPDAFMNIMHTKFEDGEDDVYICVNKEGEVAQENLKPALIIRQNAMTDMHDLDNFNPYDMRVHVGVCKFMQSFTSDEDLKAFMDFKEIKETCSFALYVDDTMTQIITIIRSNTKKIDSVLSTLKSKHTNDMIYGYEDSVIALLAAFNFISLYRMLFNIHQVDFPIELGDNTTADGLVRLNNKQIEKLENIIAWKITNVTVIKYDKDIDIRKIVSNSHIMISDEQQRIYLITYTAVAPFSENNQDVIEAMDQFKNTII